MDAEAVGQVMALLGMVPAAAETVAVDITAIAARAAASAVQPRLDDDPTAFVRAQA